MPIQSRRNLRRRKRRRLKRRHVFYIRRALIGILSIVFIISAVSLISYWIRSIKTARTNSQLREIYNSDSLPDTNNAATVEATSITSPEFTSVPVNSTPEPLRRSEIKATPVEQLTREFQWFSDHIQPGAVQLYNINHDLIGWLTIPGVVDLPVLYRDNTFYLTHDFYGTKNKAGALFLDAAHPFREDTQYMMVHGHAMNDGSMFGMLTHYRGKDYIIEHPYLTLNTLYSCDTYEIIGTCYLTTDEMYSVAKLGCPTFYTADDFNAFIENLRAHSLHFTTNEIPPDSALLALSTCYKDGRVVVFFRRTSSEPITD